jgi:xanthine dehydrogenase accessory factor
MMSIFAQLTELQRSHHHIALCTIVSSSGSTPRKPTTKMIVIDNNEPAGSIIGTIGGGAIEHFIREKAIEAIRLGQPSLVTTSLRNELGMCCGGEMTVFIEPITPKPPFICFGAGHIAQELCPLAFGLGFDVTVVDSRKDLLASDAFDSVGAKLSDASIFSFADMPFGDDTYVVITTHDHSLDQKIVEGVLTKNFKYGALVGSERKALMTKKRLVKKGFREELINRIYCPAGIPINAGTPAEIAVSIAAQMTLVRNENIKDRRNYSRSGQ